MVSGSAAGRRLCALLFIFFLEWNRMCRRAITLLILFAGLGFSAHALAVAPNLGPSLQPPRPRLPPSLRPSTSPDLRRQRLGAVSAALVLMMTAPGLVSSMGPSPPQEHSRHHDAELRHDGLITVLWPWSATRWPLSGQRLHRRPGARLSARRGPCSNPTTAHHPEQSFMIYSSCSPSSPQR